MRGDRATGELSLWSSAWSFGIMPLGAASHTVTISSDTTIYPGQFPYAEHIVVEPNVNVTIDDDRSGGFDPFVLESFVVRSGATVTGNGNSPDTSLINAQQIIVESGATITGGRVGLSANTLVLNSDATLDNTISLSIDVTDIYLGDYSRVGGSLWMELDAANVTLGHKAALFADVPMMTQPGTNWYTTGERADSDYDELSDLDEIFAGTAGGNPDTDGDLLVDGFEDRYGLDPLVADDITTDVDNDGLNLLDEQIFNTDPNSSDTDGDGTPDQQEADAGGDSTDPSDNGVAPPVDQVVDVTLTVGDWSTSESERYALQVGRIRHQAMGVGVVSTDTYKFRRGEEYEIRVHHRGSNQSPPDYDYEAAVTPTGGGYVVDPDDLLGHWEDTTSDFRAEGLTATLVIPASVKAHDISTTTTQLSWTDELDLRGLNADILPPGVAPEDTIIVFSSLDTPHGLMTHKDPGKWRWVQKAETWNWTGVETVKYRVKAGEWRSQEGTMWTNIRDWLDGNGPFASAFLPASFANASPAAKAFLKHFLGPNTEISSGQPIDDDHEFFDFKQLLQESATARAEFESSYGAVSTMVQSLEFVGTLHLTETKATLVSTGSSPWGITVGEFTGWGSATVVGSVPLGSMQYSLNFGYHLWDPYDWHPTKGAPNPSLADLLAQRLARLHLVGYAKQFMVTGNVSVGPLNWAKVHGPPPIDLE